MIREFNDEDTEEIIEVWFEASTRAHPFLDSSFMEKERLNVREVYIPNTDTWVFEIKDQVAGFISMMGNEVGAIFVRPEFQGSGIGTGLMNQVAGFHNELEVEVFERNTMGRAFCEQYGFKQVNKLIHQETGHILVRMKL